MGSDSSTRNQTETVELLARRTLELVDVSSVSRHEAPLVEVVSAALENTVPLRLHHDDCLFFCPERRDRPFVVFAGHLDTVPPQDNFPGGRDDGFVHGLGAVDMKAGLAVMIELARWGVARELAFDCGFLFFSREELPFTESPISDVLDAEPLIRGADLVVLLEPTDNALQLGCLGNLNADATFSGASAHSARPWLGRNAIHAAITGLQGVATMPPRPVDVDGLEFVEVVSVTGVQGGIARNVVPAEATCNLNFRYAPGRSPNEAEAELAGLLGEGATLTIVGNAPAGRVVLDNSLVERLQQVSGASFEPKQAWTNVAEFTGAGIDAVNFGPGDPAFAHRPDERVAIDSLAHCFSSLCSFVEDPS